MNVCICVCTSVCVWNLNKWFYLQIFCMHWQNRGEWKHKLIILMIKVKVIPSSIQLFLSKGVLALITNTFICRHLPYMDSMNCFSSELSDLMMDGDTNFHT